jgi:hypothetical protein
MCNVNYCRVGADFNSQEKTCAQQFKTIWYSHHYKLVATIFYIFGMTDNKSLWNISKIFVKEHKVSCLCKY